LMEPTPLNPNKHMNTIAEPISSIPNINNLTHVAFA